MTALTSAEFKIGDRVKYIPPDAYGDATHIGCCVGAVHGWNDQYIFIKADDIEKKISYTA